MFENSITRENTKLFNCEICEYTCRYLSDFNKHLSTKKHNKNIEETGIFHQNHYENIQKSTEYNCNHCN